MPTVLVTGASRGIGRATALWLAGKGWEVIAGVRRSEDGSPLLQAAPGRIRSVVLDITNEEQIAALDSELPARLDAVVNNAGVVVAGPLEAISSDELRRQFEVNVIGSAAVTRALLPRLRASRGRVVFVSSVSGRVATPMFGPYAASKFALEAIADVLRMELAPWKIRVVLIEPAQTDTDLWRHAESELDTSSAALAPEHQQLYGKHIEGFRRSIPRSMKAAAPVEGVAAAIERALSARRPRARYVVGREAKLQAALSAVTPTPLLDVVLRAGTGVPRRP